MRLLKQFRKYKAEYGEDIPVTAHHLIRSEEHCIFLHQKHGTAKRTGARLHVFIFRLQEMDYNKIPLRKKKLLLRFVFIIYGLLMTIMHKGV
jgi:hypothetical protein